VWKSHALLFTLQPRPLPFVESMLFFSRLHRLRAGRLFV